MRKILAKNEGERKRFRGVFVKMGKKTNYKGYSEDTVLLKNIISIETNERVTDHLWFNLTKAFEALALHEGTVLEFDARVKQYKKGYVNPRIKINHQKTDFKLSHPTKIAVIKEA